MIACLYHGDDLFLAEESAFADPRAGKPHFIPGGNGAQVLEPEREGDALTRPDRIDDATVLVEDAPSVFGLPGLEAFLEWIEHSLGQHFEWYLEIGCDLFSLILVDIYDPGLSGAAQPALGALKPEAFVEEITAVPERFYKTVTFSVHHVVLFFRRCIMHGTLIRLSRLSYHFPCMEI